MSGDALIPISPNSVRARTDEDAVRVGTLKPQVERRHPREPWHCLNFLPEPQGQGSFRPTLPQREASPESRRAAGAAISPTLIGPKAGAGLGLNSASRSDAIWA